MSALGTKFGTSLARFKRLAPKAIPEGFVPITQFHAEDIFVVGYPKSGNTWFQNLVAGVVYGVDPRWAP